jgi:hypothetical protein
MVLMVGRDIAPCRAPALSRNDAVDWGARGVSPTVFGLWPKTSSAGQANVLVSSFLPAIQSAGRRLERQLELDKYCPHLAGWRRSRSPFLSESLRLSGGGYDVSRRAQSRLPRAGFIPVGLRSELRWIASKDQDRARKRTAAREVRAVPI